MRLLKCKKVESYLLSEGLTDERNIWCYAQLKGKISDKDENVYGSALVCVKGDDFFIYNAEFNSIKMELYYTCKISEMKNVVLKKKNPFFTRVCFERDKDWFQLDLDDWKRFSDIWELEEFKC